jgi:hypothetical protein
LFWTALVRTGYSSPRHWSSQRVHFLTSRFSNRVGDHNLCWVSLV